MNLITDTISEYADSHTSRGPGILKEIERETHVNNLFPRMISGHLQGRLLAMISAMIRPSCILEIGTYTGYSAICLSEGLASGGMIHSIEINIELEESIRANLSKAGVENKVKIYMGDAMVLIPEMQIRPDLVFLDGDKINYTSYYNLLFDRITSGGYLIADNVLWSGKVLDKDSKDKEARKLNEFNDYVQQDARVQNILLPVRDGIMLIQKRE